MVPKSTGKIKTRFVDFKDAFDAKWKNDGRIQNCGADPGACQVS